MQVTSDHRRSQRFADGNQAATQSIILARRFVFEFWHRRRALLARIVFGKSKLVPSRDGHLRRHSTDIRTVLEGKAVTSKCLKVLSLQPWHGGSHRQFSDGWANRSQHQWTTIGLPDRNWKWRMRHAAIEFARDIEQRSADGESWDVVVCTDMLNAAELRALAKPISDLPIVVYFHENQFAYPARGKQHPDHHFLITNFVSAIAADEVWFNSKFNLDSMVRGLIEHSKTWPDFDPQAEIDSIRSKSKIIPPPISFPHREVTDLVGRRKSHVAKGDPLHLVWAARWEYDKNPEALLDCLLLLDQQRVPFRLSVIGEQAEHIPDALNKIRDQFELQIESWGYQESREAYWSVLESADVLLSTASHEFFGLSVAEGISVGAWPLLPHRLAYPELIGVEDSNDRADLFLYQSSAKHLAAKIRKLDRDRDWNFGALELLVRDLRTRLEFKNCVVEMDRLLLKLGEK